jgi:Rod binding domain-containing protein
MSWDPLQLKTPGDAKRQNVAEAAAQFEGILIGQLLRTTRDSDGCSWMGTPGGPAGDHLTEFAEQQVAALIASKGGLGLARLVGQGLEELRKGDPSVTR